MLVHILRMPLLTSVTDAGTDTGGEGRLVERARGGDNEAFAELYNRYARLIYAILLARVPPEQAEDLVQDVFLCAYRRLATLRDPGALRGWLAAIARSHAAEFHRSTHQTRTVSLTNTERRDPGYDSALLVLDAIRKLPEAYRETLILRLVEGMTGPEIAAKTGLTPDSVRVNLSRGMKLLRAELT